MSILMFGDVAVSRWQEQFILAGIAAKVVAIRTGLADIAVWPGNGPVHWKQETVAIGMRGGGA